MFGIDDMAVAGGLGALANLGGGLIGANSAQNVNAQQMAMQRDANFANLSFARDQMEFQRAWNQSNKEQAYDFAQNKYRWTMEDMRRAGLNPLLAYQQGASPGSVGSGSGSSASAGQSGVSGLQNPGEHLSKGIANAVSSAVDAAKTVQGVKLMQQQAKTQETTQQLQEEQARAAIAAAKRDEAAATAANAQAAKTTAETSLVVPAQAGMYHAAGAQHSAGAHATTEDARRKREFGDSWLGQQLNTVQQVGKRLIEAGRNWSASGGGVVDMDGNHVGTGPGLVIDIKRR